MEINRMDPDALIRQIIEKYGETVFQEAVIELERKSILFEGQFPFLTDASMKDRNLETLRTIFKKYGFEDAEKIQNFSFNIPSEGWMHCLAILGERFNSTEQIEKLTIAYYS